MNEFENTKYNEPMKIISPEGAFEAEGQLETFGKDWKLIQKLYESGKNNHIWSVFDYGDDIHIKSGLDSDAIFYFVSKLSWPQENLEYIWFKSSWMDN